MRAIYLGTLLCKYIYITPYSSINIIHPIHPSIHCNQSINHTYFTHRPLSLSSHLIPIYSASSYLIPFYISNLFSRKKTSKYSYTREYVIDNFRDICISTFFCLIRNSSSPLSSSLLIIHHPSPIICIIIHSRARTRLSFSVTKF